MKIAIAGMVALFVFSMAYVYAEQQVLVPLPVDRPFEAFDCYDHTFSVMDGKTWFHFDCHWRWSFPTEVYRSFPPTEHEIGDREGYKLWLKEVLPLIESNPYIEPGEETEQAIEEEAAEPPSAIETLDPEVREALDKLGECQFGENEWAAIVANYTKVVPDELPIFTSGLDRQRIINELARNFEECRGMTEYEWLSEEYQNKFLADTLGLDYHGRPQTNFGLDESRNYESQKTATKKEVEDQGKYYQEWICKDENLHLGLCPHQFTGANRGGQTPGANCQHLGQPGQAPENVCPLDALAEHKRNEPELIDNWEKIYRAQCDNYKQRYQHMASEDRPEWVQHCPEN